MGLKFWGDGNLKMESMNQDIMLAELKESKAERRLSLTKGFWLSWQKMFTP